MHHRIKDSSEEFKERWGLMLKEILFIISILLVQKGKARLSAGEKEELPCVFGIK